MMPFQGMSNVNNVSSSDEHEELLAEMELIERLPTQERLKQAKRRRALQLKKWADNEREYQQQQQQQQQQQGADLMNNFFFERGPTDSTRSSTKRKRDGSNRTSGGGAAGVRLADTNKRRSIKFQDHIVLLDAIMRKDYDEVERLLEVVGVTPNSANEDGLTAIHQCCIDDSAELLRLLIRNGADVNVCDNDLWTPLHAAATCANLEICKILIENKAELLAVNTDGNMPYDICDDELCLEYIESEMAHRGVTQQAIDMKRSETEMRMLDDLKQLCLTGNSFSGSLDSNACQNFTSYFRNAVEADGTLNLNAKDSNGATLMHIACANGYTSILEFLLIDCQLSIETGAPLIGPSIFVTDNDGWTPLHVATFWGHQKAIEILLEHGADINLKTNNDETVLELCDDPDIRHFIIQKNKEIESQQEQAAVMAAMQKQMQLMSNINSISSHLHLQNHQNLSNTSSANGSIKKSNVDSSNSIVNGNANNSTRSLKRTSTGVSRSSSVRRSSFRDKEKAARKLDTSFKDVLFANELDEQHLPLVEKAAAGESPALTQAQNKITSVVKIINNKTNSETLTNLLVNPQTIIKSSNLSPRNPPKELPSNIDTAANVNSNNNSHNSKTSINVANNKAFADDFNNNHLKIVKNNLKADNVNNSNASEPCPIARVLVNNDGSATVYSSNANPAATVPTIILNNSVNPINQSTLSSNFSMSSSLVSTSSNSQNASSSLSQAPTGNNMTSSLQSGNTISASSIAIIDMNNPAANNRITSTTMIGVEHVDYAGLHKPYAYSKSLTVATTTIQPRFNGSNDYSTEKNAADFSTVVGDGVKYKFVSNETIGAKSAMNNEFCDIQSDTESNKFRKCTKCLKCCFVM